VHAANTTETYGTCRVCPVNHICFDRSSCFFDGPCDVTHNLLEALLLLVAFVCLCYCMSFVTYMETLQSRYDEAMGCTCHRTGAFRGPDDSLCPDSFREAMHRDSVHDCRPLLHECN
jgi:hypothetical protein